MSGRIPTRGVDFKAQLQFKFRQPAAAKPTIRGDKAAPKEDAEAIIARQTRGPGQEATALINRLFGEASTFTAELTGTTRVQDGFEDPLDYVAKDALDNLDVISDSNQIGELIALRETFDELSDPQSSPLFNRYLGKLVYIVKIYRTRPNHQAAGVWELFRQALTDLERFAPETALKEAKLFLEYALKTDSQSLEKTPIIEATAVLTKAGRNGDLEMIKNGFAKFIEASGSNIDISKLSGLHPISRVLEHLFEILPAKESSLIVQQLMAKGFIKISDAETAAKLLKRYARFVDNDKDTQKTWATNTLMDHFEKAGKQVLANDQSPEFAVLAQLIEVLPLNEGFQDELGANIARRHKTGEAGAHTWGNLISAAESLAYLHQTYPHLLKDYLDELKRGSEDKLTDLGKCISSNLWFIVDGKSKKSKDYKAIVSAYLTYPEVQTAKELTHIVEELYQDKGLQNKIIEALKQFPDQEAIKTTLKQNTTDIVLIESMDLQSRVSRMANNLLALAEIEGVESARRLAFNEANEIVTGMQATFRKKSASRMSASDAKDLQAQAKQIDIWLYLFKQDAIQNALGSLDNFPTMPTLVSLTPELRILARRYHEYRFYIESLLSKLKD
jgi:hypothetical protein